MHRKVCNGARNTRNHPLIRISAEAYHRAAQCTWSVSLDTYWGPGRVGVAQRRTREDSSPRTER